MVGTMLVSSLEGNPQAVAPANPKHAADFMKRYTIEVLHTKWLAIPLLVLFNTAAAQVNEPVNAEARTDTDQCVIPISLTRIRPNAEGAPVTVEVNILLMDLYGIGEEEEQFSVDLAVMLRWRDSRLSAANRGRSLENCRLGLAEIWDPAVSPVNLRGAIRNLERDVDIDESGVVSVTGRISGDFAANLDLHEYPFDSQRLVVQFASIEYGPADVQLAVSSQGSGRLDDFSPSDWQILSNFSTIDVPTVTTFLGEHSRLDHEIVVGRLASDLVWTVIVPLCFIVLMAAMVFWIDATAFVPQFSVSTASIFTLIAFLLGLRQDLPPIPYLSRLDLLVLASTMWVFVALFEVVVISRMVVSGNVEQARRVDYHARWIYPLGFVMVLIYTLRL
jgi:hypothetical protein